MRRAVVLVLAASVALAACELQPAPKKQAAPVEVVPPQPPPAQPPQQPQPVVVADAGVADAAGPPPIQASEACIKVAAHVVQAFIDTAKDPAQAAVYEQERMKMTKATAEACDRQGWGADAMKCYLLAKDPAGIKACENKFPPVEPKMGSAAGSAAPPPPPIAGSGAGSAAPKKAPPPPANAGSGSPKKIPAPTNTGSGAAKVPVR